MENVSERSPLLRDGEEHRLYRASSFVTSCFVFSYFVLLYFVLAFASCKNDSNTTGGSLLSDQDRIIVGCDTFSTSSSIIEAFDIYTTPDSFLLGECDSRFGTIHADILAQFACPVGFVFPENAVVDSAYLFFYYSSWFGDGYSPLTLSIYRMDKNTLDYNSDYSHDIDVEDYVTLSDDNMVIDRIRVIVPAEPTDSVYLSSTGSYEPFVKMRLKDDIAKELFNSDNFTNIETFTQAFKGLYIQSDFGSANLLHIEDINIALYYHFTYEKNGRDTTVNDTKGFYANSEVRQVNRYIYLNIPMESLRADSDSVCYIVAPANIYTRISLPIRNMAQHITDQMKYVSAAGDTMVKRPYVNMANLDIEVLNHYDGYSRKTRDDWAQPAEYMLLIKEDAVDRFFSHNELPSDTCAILSPLVTVDDGTGVSTYGYSYDLAGLLTNAIRKIQEEKEKDETADLQDDLNMVLVPVSVKTSTSSSSYYSYTTSSANISSVKQEQTVSATVIRASQNEDDPLDIEVVFSGF